MGHRPRAMMVALFCGLAMSGCLEGASTTEPDAEPDYTNPVDLAKGLGDQQSMLAGQEYSPLTVIVFTATQHKCNACSVTWTLSPGAFTGGPVHTTTDVTGEAKLRITSLSPAGQYRVRATIANSKFVEFTLTAR